MLGLAAGFDVWLDGGSPGGLVIKMVAIMLTGLAIGPPVGLAEALVA